MRVAVTILAIVIGLAFVVSVYIRSADKEAQRESTAAALITADSVEAGTVGETTTPDAAALPAPAADVNQQDAAAPVTPDSAPQARATTPSTADLGRLVAQGASQPQSSTLGSADEKSPYTMRVDLSSWGASIRRITLADYHNEATGNSPYVVQGNILTRSATDQLFSYYPFAARSITINNQRVDLESVAWSLVSPGKYQVDILAQGEPVLRLTREYSLAPGKDNYEIQLNQSVENLTSQPVTAVWEQSIQAEQPLDAGTYMGDQRRLYVGYYDPKYDPQRKYVVTEDGLFTHPSVLSAWQEDRTMFWPLASDPHYEMVWFGEANRYFASVVHRPALPDPATGKLKVTPLHLLFPKLSMREVTAAAPQGQETPEPGFALPNLIYSLTSKPLTIAPNQKVYLDLALFAGPRESTLFAKQPYNELGLQNLIHYELSCAVCTFQWLAKGLLGFLKGIHYVLGDWGVAIIILVLVVRIILHPITKKSQIAMTKMGKQMATIQPEIEKIKKKFADDQTKQNAEIMRLYREKGINPAGMLGCLPMFLQTPIWIALYAMLYFAIELRHQPAFYGVFQAISGGNWAFLADLSSPDNFISFSKSFTLNLIFVHPKFDGINIIPLLMAIFFYFQQALMMPPAANEQQAQQQKIGKYMTLMIPIFLYSAPSGLTLYMLASSIGGMVDGYIVRRHIKKQEEAGTLFTTKPRKEPKPGGLWDRVQKALQAQQAKIQQAQQQPPKKRK